MKISPEHPRALYYNDDVYVGSVHDGKTIEIVSFDPMQGAIFYLVDEQRSRKTHLSACRAGLHPVSCRVWNARHTRRAGAFGSTPRQSGSLVPRIKAFIDDQESPLKDRWGGWYVSGSLAKGSLANTVFTQPPAAAGAGQTEAVATAHGSGPFDSAAYLAPGSDQVALLVLAHQTQMHNLITLTNYKTRLGLYALEKAAGAEQGAAAGPAPALETLPEKPGSRL